MINKALHLFSAAAVFFVWSIKAQDKEIPSSLDRSLDTGDPQAIEKVLQLQPSEAVGILVRKITLYNRSQRGSEYPGYRESMLEALASIPGHAEIIEERIEGQSGVRGSSGVRAACFQILGQLATDEAAWVAIRFANDYRDVPDNLKTIDPLGSADDFSPNAEMAVEALGAMNLPDAPVRNKRPMFYTGKERHAWRQWAEAKLKELPDNPVEYGQVPDPNSLKPSPLENPTTANNYTESSPGWPRNLAIAFAAILLAAAAVCWKQRRRSN